jgi:hypothetical protein
MVNYRAERRAKKGEVSHITLTVFLTALGDKSAFMVHLVKMGFK